MAKLKKKPNQNEKKKSRIKLNLKDAISVQAFSQKLIEIVKLLSNIKTLTFPFDESRGKQSKVLKDFYPALFSVVKPNLLQSATRTINNTCVLKLHIKCKHKHL